MKLLQLEILNLASLDKQGGEVINFVKGSLGESTIFSIVGPTGSGKSTILDAICLALYNRAPRYPRKKGDRNRKIEIYGQPDDQEKNRPAPTDCCNILTRGKKEGYSKLTFQANNGLVYRAEWHIRFKTKKYEEPTTVLYKISFSADGTTQAEEVAEWNDIPLIIGLDYEQFLRTVLIAQGSFANFLTAKEDERYELLEKLIGCEELYTRIANEIKNKKSEAVEAFNQVNASVDAVRQNLLSDEEQKRLEEEIKRLEKAEKAISDTKKQLETQLQWYTDDEKLLAAIDQQQTAVDHAQQQLDEFQPTINKLNLHDAITPAIDGLREVKRIEAAIKETEKNIADYEQQIERQNDLIQTADNQLQQLSAAADKWQKDIDEAKPHIQKARELKTKVDAAKTVCQDQLTVKTKAEKEKDKAEQAVKDNIAAIDKAQNGVSKAEKELQTKQEEVAQKKKELEGATAQAEKQLKDEKLKVEGMNAEELQNQKTDAETDWLQINQAIEVAGQIKNAKDEEIKSKTRNQELEDRNAVLSAELEKLDIDALENEVTTLQKTYTLMTSEKWNQHRALLAKGKPCPLCGATEHPYQVDKTGFDDATSDLHHLLQGKEATLKSQKKQKEDWTGEKKKNEGEIEGLQKRLLQLQQDIKKYESEWQRLLEWNPQMTQDQTTLESTLPSYRTKKEEAKAKLSHFNQVQREIGRLTKVKDQADKRQRTYEKEAGQLLEKAQAELHAAQTKLAQEKALTTNLCQQQEEKRKAWNDAANLWIEKDNILKDLQEAYRHELGGEDPEVVERRLNKGKEAADDAVTQQKEKISKLNVTLGEKKGQWQSKKEQLDQERQDVASKNAELTEWMAQYNGREDRLQEITLADVEVMYHATDDWSAIRQEKQHRNEKVVSASALLTNAKKTHNEHQAAQPEKGREVLLADLKELEENSHHDELVAAKARMQNHDDAIRSLGDKAEELKRVTKLKDDWTAITEAIGSDGKTLRKIAQCYTLNFLIEHANAEIRKFNSRYELQQVKNSLGIRVIDHDRADDVRDITSLSGGETFIVSLGLALGLSSLSSRNISFENLFIDEGFGTLDPDTLSVVINSLAMLQSSQGKKVGVISHTDTMQENITTQIRIIKNGSSGSSHIEIYP